MIITVAELVISAFIIIIVFLIIIIIITYRLVDPPDIPNNRLSYDNIKPRLKTGDLLVVSYNSPHGYLIKMFTKSIWSHIGMIYIDTENNLNIIECSYYNKDVKNVLKVPLDFWLQYNCSCNIAWLQLNGPSIDKNILVNVFRSINDGYLDRIVINWIPSVMHTKYYPRKKKSFFCSELIAYMYQEFNIIKKELLPCNYSPKSFISHQLPFTDDYSLSPPVLFRVPCSE